MVTITSGGTVPRGMAFHDSIAEDRRCKSAVVTKIFVYQKWPDKFFRIVNFVFSHQGVP